MKPLGDRTRLLAAALLFAAAAVHAVAAYVTDHLETQLFYVFWGIVIVQVTVGLTVLARVPAGAVMALIVNVVVIAAYTVSRLVPLPGEEMAEPVELLRLVSKAIEIGAPPAPNVRDLRGPAGRAISPLRVPARDSRGRREGGPAVLPHDLVRRHARGAAGDPCEHVRRGPRDDDVPRGRHGVRGLDGLRVREQHRPRQAGDREGPRGPGPLDVLAHPRGVRLHPAPPHPRPSRRPPAAPPGALLRPRRFRLERGGDPRGPEGHGPVQGPHVQGRVPRRHDDDRERVRDGPHGLRGPAALGRSHARPLRLLAEARGPGTRLVAERVIRGVGRAGRWFGSETVGLRPDAMVFAKGFTGGYAPLGAGGFGREGGERLRTTGFPHGLTFGAHPLGCTAARETLRILRTEGLVERAKRMGALLRARFEGLREGRPGDVSDVRGAGLFLAPEL